MRRSYFQKMKTILPISGLAFMLFAIDAPAHAQMSNNPWGFQPQNRASVAALIRQVENGKDGASAVTAIAATPSYTNLVCGSESKSSASGNTTCIILNNADGNISVGQDSQGDPTAISSPPEDVSKGNADDVLTALGGTVEPEKTR